MMLFKKLALQLLWKAQAARAVQYLFGKDIFIGYSKLQVVRYEECSDDDKKYLITYDNMLGELKALRMLSYNRYKNNFIGHLTSTDSIRREAARDLLDNEFITDRDDITKILILK
jgi:hypothetical protein